MITLVCAVLVRAEPPPEDKLPESLFHRFESEIYPMMTRSNEKSCVSCHDDEGSSDLVFTGHAQDDFRILMDRRYFALEGPDTLLSRVGSTNPKRRMPKGKSAKPWTLKEINTLKSFLQEASRFIESDEISDESFPAALLRPYEGPSPPRNDNQFITYTQLKGKIQSIFEDDWIREGKDLFAENVAFFNGADFIKRFNESSLASSSFITGLDMLGQDVASRAFRRKSGPFKLHPLNLPSPLGTPVPTQAYKESIGNLYQSMLYRMPSKDEVHQAYAMLQAVHQEDSAIKSQGFEIGFKLQVHDPATRLMSEQLISVPVSAGPLGIYQEWLDQTQGAALNQREEQLRVATLNRLLRLRRDQPGQKITIHRLRQGESASLAAVRIRSVEYDYESIVGITHASVTREGAWQLKTDDGFTSLEYAMVADTNGSIQIPIEVPHDADHEISLIWRKGEHLSSEVLVEVTSPSPTTLAMPGRTAKPQAGQAKFNYDSSEDTHAFIALPAAFRFDENGYIEVNNRDTDRRVTIGALNFVSTDNGTNLEIDAREAEGNEGWKAFKSGSFRAYNSKGTPLEDENKNKGERFLRFRPSLKKKLWNTGSFYHVHIHYPGKRDHETRVPVMVHAIQSSPIIQLEHPTRAKTGTNFTIDASGSYTVQQSVLQFHWEQIKGTPVRFESVGPVLKVHVAPTSLDEAAWTALARALLRHPDFIFARPPSIDLLKDNEAKRTLKLVQIALDLLGRPPSASERKTLEAGATLSSMVDTYLASDAFRLNYFRKIRLYLESQGTDSQDEPARLWCHIAFEDLPFSEILTADYTVDRNFRRQKRPDYHGRTGLLTSKGFIEGKPGLPHYNYAAQVSMLFLGYTFELPAEINEAREGITALGTTDPDSMCYSCHKILTPLAMQRGHWADDGTFRRLDASGTPLRADDRGWVKDYPFKGDGMEAFATQAVKKERFIRTIINTHFHFYFGRPMRYLKDERGLYQRLWNNVHTNHFKIRTLIRAIICSPEYLGMEESHLANGRQTTEYPSAEKTKKEAPKGVSKLLIGP